MGKLFRMIRLALALCLTLPAAAQESFQLETETSGCFGKPRKQTTRWELHRDRYTSNGSKVVLDSAQVKQFCQGLLALPHDEDSEDGAPDWNKFSPEVRRQAFQEITRQYALRPDLKDLAEGINANPFGRLINEAAWFGGTEWKLSFSGLSPLQLSTSGASRPLPMFTVTQDSQHWGVVSYEAIDFLRILQGQKPGAELEFYLVSDRGRWRALQELQDQPQFPEWEATFRIDQARTGSIPKYYLKLEPRVTSPIDTIDWQTQQLDSRFSLSEYRDCLARLETTSWLKQWKGSSPGRTIELRLEGPGATDLWEHSGLPGRLSHQLELKGPDGQSATLLMGDGTDLSLVTSNNPSRVVEQHWLDKLRLKFGQVALVEPNGSHSLRGLGDPK